MPYSLLLTSLGYVANRIQTSRISLMIRKRSINDVLESDPEDFVKTPRLPLPSRSSTPGIMPQFPPSHGSKCSTCNGADVTITSSIDQVEYILSGTSPDGMFKLYSDKNSN
ncbi:MAG: hypothetical protein ACLU4J_14190 [Butyricimonas paravirosa]